jgi:RNA polymerase sigma-70 factor (ECF subfamily)
MFDNTNPYSLRTEAVGGLTRYYVSFTDGQHIPRETEVSRPVYAEFLRFVKYERKLRRRDERHGDGSDLTNEATRKKMKNPPKSLEDKVFDRRWNERLRASIQRLPEIQRRRFVLRHEFGLTYEQIGEMEGCAKMPVKRSVDRAEEAIRKAMEDC